MLLFINYFNYNLFYLKEHIFASLSTQTFAFKTKFLPVFLLWTFILVNINENPFASRLGVDIWFQDTYLGGWLIERKLLLKKLILQFQTIESVLAIFHRAIMNKLAAVHACPDLLLCCWDEHYDQIKLDKESLCFRYQVTDWGSQSRSTRQEAGDRNWSIVHEKMLLVPSYYFQLYVHIYIYHTNCILYIHLI